MISMIKAVTPPNRKRLARDRSVLIAGQAGIKGAPVHEVMRVARTGASLYLKKEETNYGHIC